MTTVAEYLEQTGMSEEELAARVGVKAVTVDRRAREGAELPKRWARELGLLEPEGPGDVSAGVPADEPGREQEFSPQPPPDARFAEPSPTAGLDFSTLAGHIEGAYRLGAHVLTSSGDTALGKAIEDHARQAGEAWARWVESEPKVAAFLQRMMVGTPLGEVIAVHVAIGFSYFLARSALDRARREAELDESEPGVEGNGVPFAPGAAFAGA